MSDPTAFLREKTWQVEPGWWEAEPDGFSHWPFRLRQRIAHEELDDGFVRWSATTDVIRDVRDLDQALALCHALNRHTAGWSYVINERRARSRASPPPSSSQSGTSPMHGG